MSSGDFTIVVNHFCGCPINVQIKWSSTYPTRDYPGDYDEDRFYGCEHFHEPVERCPKCGVMLDDDDIFQTNVTNAAIGTTDWGERGPADEVDYDPPEPEWDEVWEKIDPRYN